ncbi:hypothetical protein ABGB19_09515 [Mycobacterium sp. B14F4]|uniref:hypothetical protein n=1 Tax=Mycobacterium sp. B14F4 TaxID=3153565 RepID=UPI00325D7A2D
MPNRTAQQKTNLKRASAVMGGSAVVALAALGVAIGQDSGTTVGAPDTGAATTSTTPVKMASPTIKGPAPLPSEQAAATD